MSPDLICIYIPWRLCERYQAQGWTVTALPRQHGEYSMLATQPDLFGARPARDEALGQVSANAGDFMAEALQAVLKLPRGVYTGEDIRLELERQEIVPHHHNAWGALIRQCVASGALRFSGRYEAMKTRRSHARRTPVYVR